MASGNGQGAVTGNINWRGRWRRFVMVACGLGLTVGGLGRILGSLRALETLGVSGHLEHWLIFTLFLLIGALAMMLGLLLLGLGVDRFRKEVKISELQWIDWILLFLISGIVASVLLLALPSLPAVSADVELPIPADSLTGSTDPLYPGAVVEVVASLPGPSGTPTPQTFTGLEVLAVIMEAGEAGEGGKGTVLVAVAPERAPELQKALITENARFTYRLLPGTPTPTVTPTATPTSTEPAPIPTLSSGEAYLRIDILKVDLVASTLMTGTAQLVIVEKLEVPPLMVVGTGEESVVTPVAVSGHAVITCTVTVVTFLDQDGVRHDVYHKDKSKQVLIRLSGDRLANVARGLAGAESIWLVRNP